MERVLALDLTTRILAYAVLEGSERLLDWGLPQARSKEQLEKSLRALRASSLPVLVVCANLDDPRRGPSSKRLKEALRTLGIKSVPASRTLVHREYASSGTSKHQIAIATARLFPELEPWLPRERTLGSVEDERAGIFVAVSSAFAVLRERERSRVEP